VSVVPVTPVVNGNVLSLECVGSYAIEDLKNAFHEGLADPACPPRVALLFDVRKSASLSMRTAAEMQDVARFLGEHAETIGRRCAVVVAEDVQYGLIRMGSTFGQDSGVRTEIFREVPQALAWLEMT
jgi:hypothetical protein